MTSGPSQGIIVENPHLFRVASTSDQTLKVVLVFLCFVARLYTFTAEPVMPLDRVIGRSANSPFSYLVPHGFLETVGYLADARMLGDEVSGRCGL